MPYLVDISGRPDFLGGWGREFEEWIWGRGAVEGGTCRSGGRGNSGQDVMYKGRIKSV